MLALTRLQTRRALFLLISFHIIIIAASNYLVQLPFQIGPIHSTWGTLTFPFIFLATDLTVRIFGAREARKIIFAAMLPALVFSYLFSVVFVDGSFQGFAGLSTWNTFVFRIALASFTAYVLGQLLDIRVFSKLRKNTRWWIAPAASTVAGNLIDTAVFYAIAFFRCSDPFMASHWVEIGCVDYAFKLLVSLALFLPLYGVVLKVLTEAILTEPTARMKLS